MVEALTRFIMTLQVKSIPSLQCTATSLLLALMSYIIVPRRRKNKGGALKVLAQKPKTEGAPLSFLIRHEISSGITDVGFLDPIANGLRFTGKIDNQDISVNIML